MQSFLNNKNTEFMNYIDIVGPTFNDANTAY